MKGDGERLKEWEKWRDFKTCLVESGGKGRWNRLWILVLEYQILSSGAEVDLFPFNNRMGGFLGGSVG